MNKIKSITRGQVILCFLILIAIGGVYFGIKKMSSNSIDDYKSFEKELKSATKNYLELNDIQIEEDTEEMITLEELNEFNLLSSDLKDECKGYVYAENQEDPETEEYKIQYYSYIKCGKKYTTENYVNY